MSIRVLVVDDSALIRSLLGEIIRQESDMTLIGAAADAYQAKEMVQQHRPDVITLDVEMPKVDGLTFLEKLMKAQPTPVLMISTLTEQGAAVTLRALELGAVDYIPKPKLGVAQGIEQYRQLICDKIRIAAKAKVGQRPTMNKVQSNFKYQSTEKVIAVGASTGGTEAIRELLQSLPADMPGMVITQHMPPGFTATFAARLNQCTPFHVTEAKGGERLVPGRVFIAPGSLHLRLKRSGADYVTEVVDGPLVSGHKPSVDDLFYSVAQTAGANALGVILTGMGKDGAQGMLAMQQAGAHTLAQDEHSSLIYGMPKEAVKMGGVDQSCALDKMGQMMVDYLVKMGKGHRI